MEAPPSNSLAEAVRLPSVILHVQYRFLFPGWHVLPIRISLLLFLVAADARDDSKYAERNGETKAWRYRGKVLKPPTVC